MRYVSTVLPSLVVVLISVPRLLAGGGPDAEIDGKKLVGKWAWGTKDYHGATVFTADGVMKIHSTKVLVQTTSEAKYTLKGNSLTFITKPSPEKEEKIVVTVTKLTDRELQFRDNTGHIETWKRVKEEKK